MAATGHRAIEVCQHRVTMKLLVFLVESFEYTASERGSPLGEEQPEPSEDCIENAIVSFIQCEPVIGREASKRMLEIDVLLRTIEIRIQIFQGPLINRAEDSGQTNPCSQSEKDDQNRDNQKRLLESKEQLSLIHISEPTRPSP